MRFKNRLSYTLNRITTVLMQLNKSRMEMKMKLMHIILLMSLTIISSSCTDDDSTTPDVPDYTTTGVYIVNEGTFQSNNASLSFYSPEMDTVFNHVFAAANNGAELGDVAQNMVIRGDYGYVIVNNSDTIEVIRLSDNQRERQIVLPAGFSPRDLLILNDDKAYVTSLYTASVAVINPETGQLITTIPVGDNPEEMAFSNNKIYVANSGFGSGSTVSVIDTESDQVIGSVTVGDNPVNLEVDAMGDVLVLCWCAYNDWQDPDDDTPGQLMRINPVQDIVTDTLVVGGHPSDLALGPNDRGYFVSEQGVELFNTATFDILGSTLIEGAFYGIDVEVGSGQIYVADALDYVSNGEFSIYNAEGERVGGPYTVGVAPGAFAFVLEQ